MELTSKHKRYLRGLAHHRTVVVTVGQHGISDAVRAEIDLALSAHELIKIRLPIPDRAHRRHCLEDICRQSGAVSVQSLGRVETLYRPASKPRIVLP